MTYRQVKDLAEAIERPPYSLDQGELWRAYEQLERDRVRRAGPQKLLTDVVSLVRFALGQEELLVPFPDLVEGRFRDWLAAQETTGRRFSEEQLAWLERIKEHVAASWRVGLEDFEYAPFYEMGGPVRVRQLFGAELGAVLEELNEALVG